MEHFANTDHFLLKKQHGDENCEVSFPVYILNSHYTEFLEFFSQNFFFFFLAAVILSIYLVVFGFSGLAHPLLVDFLRFCIVRLMISKSF